MLKRLHLLLALFILTVNAAMAQITTSGISGKITSDGEMSSELLLLLLTNLPVPYIVPLLISMDDIPSRVCDQAVLTR